MSQSTQVERQPVNVKKEIWEWVKALAIAGILFLIIHNFLFTMIRVDGDSMKETLHNGDRMAVTILDMKLYGPGRGDIVICTYPGADHYCVKRVIGLPGETIEIRGGITYINGEPLEEDYIEYRPKSDYGEYQIPEGHYFVMGDNRLNSHDSRYADVGALQRDAIMGKARLICWPFDRFRTI